MTDTEINELVAKGLGWMWREGAQEKIYSRSIGNGKGVATKTLPDYCHDIKAAWEIVEYCLSQGHSVNIHSDKTTEIQVDVQICAIDIYEATDDTAPRAICLAFLKLKE